MAEEEKSEAEEGAPKSKKMLIIIIAVVVVLIAAGGAAFFLMSGEEEESDSSETTEQAIKPAIYFDIEPAFVANYNWQGQKHYAQISLAVMTRNPEVVESLKRHMPLVKNNLLMLFSSQDFSGLKTLEGKESLRQKALEEIQGIIKEELGEPGVEKVLFTNFVMQ